MADVKRDPTALYCDDVSLTQQNLAPETDINLIVRRAQAGIDPTHVNSKAPMYGDFTNIPSYQDAFDIVKRSELLFMSLPWEVRERFSNDPQKMVSFLQDSKNREEAVKLGLVKAPDVKPVDDSLSTLKSIDASLKARSGGKESKRSADD